MRRTFLQPADLLSMQTSTSRAAFAVLLMLYRAVLSCSLLAYTRWDRSTGVKMRGLDFRLLRTHHTDLVFPFHPCHSLIIFMGHAPPISTVLFSHPPLPSPPPSSPQLTYAEHSTVQIPRPNPQSNRHTPTSPSSPPWPPPPSRATSSTPRAPCPSSPTVSISAAPSPTLRESHPH